MIDLTKPIAAHFDALPEFVTRKQLAQKLGVAPSDPVSTLQIDAWMRRQGWIAQRRQLAGLKVQGYARPSTSQLAASAPVGKAQPIEQLRALVEAVRVFRNEPALARLGGLRGTPGYIGLCQAWDDARDWLDDTMEAIPQVCDAELTASERDELQRLRALINTPHTEDWMRATELEAAHQVERWSTNHDAGKQPEDWFWLLGYLSGKALASFRTGNREKGLHHIVSSSAALLNWHRNVTGNSTTMRPGIDAAPLERETTGATQEQQP